MSNLRPQKKAYDDVIELRGSTLSTGAAGTSDSLPAVFFEDLKSCNDRRDSTSMFKS